MECKCSEKKTIRSEETKNKINVRVNKIVGQLNGIKRMVEEDRYCEDVLIQLAAIDKSVKSLAALVLDQHLRSCIVKSIREGDENVVEEISDIFKRFN